MKMRNYQALYVYQGENKSYVITTTVAEFKRLINSTKSIEESNENKILFNKDSIVEWNNVELELNDEYFYGAGFLSFPFKLENETIQYNTNIGKLDDYDTITISCERP